MHCFLLLSTTERIDLTFDLSRGYNWNKTETKLKQNKRKTIGDFMFR